MKDFTETAKKIFANATQGNVNVLYPFIEMPTDKKLSIVGKYENKEDLIVNGVGETISFDENNYYYGLTPKFGSDEICELLKHENFKDCESFDKFIDDNSNLFTLPAKMRKYARALFAKTLVKMSTMFGYNIICQDEECYIRLCKIVENIATKNIDYDVNEQTHSIRLLGQPSEQIIKILNDNFLISTEGKLIIKNEVEQGNFIIKLSHMNISLVQGKCYYSGVLPRVKSFKLNNPEHSNADVMSLIVKFGRTTFATMDAFDSSYIKNHRLLEKYKILLEELDMREDMLIQNLLNLTDSSKNMLDRINIFLEQSYSAHNLAVSGNIITADGYLILAERGQKTIDSKTYYCSINGQSEILDKRVNLYWQSVYEDKPTININEPMRIDFMGEFERETKAELNINCPANDWSLQGISFLSIFNQNNIETSQRRFHFNILGECHTEFKLSDIITKQEKAAESFENGNIIGVKINYHKNVFLKVTSLLKSSIVWILKSKDLITSIFALAIFFIGINELLNTEFTIKSLWSICSMVFTFLSLIVLIKNIVIFTINYIKRKNTHYKLSLLSNHNDFYEDIHCKLKNKKISLHPIADLMIYEYIKYFLN